MKAISRFIWIVVLTTFCVACGGNGNGKSQRVQVQPPEPPVVTVGAGLKQLVFSWADVAGAAHYKLYENPDGHSGFTQVGAIIPAGTLSVTMPIAVHLHDFPKALYIVEACNVGGCTGSSEVNAIDMALNAIGYFKASNTGAGDYFGGAVALSADGNTLAVGAHGEDSAATGINGDENDNSADFSGAVYIFRFDGNDWHQQAYVKASVLGNDEGFGSSVALSADGNTLAVGARESRVGSRGAVFVFHFDGADWSEQAYIKGPYTDEYWSAERRGFFGYSVALSADGNALAVGDPYEHSAATGINGDESDRSAFEAGAAYIFRFDGAEWRRQAYIKASNTGGGWPCGTAHEEPGCFGDRFGSSVALSADGNTLAIGAPHEDSPATGINGYQGDAWDLGEGIIGAESGAAYLFRFDGTDWSQQAYIKASNTDGFDGFSRVALSADGGLLAVGATGEDSNATGVNGDQDDNSAENAGAVYVFRFDGTDWSQQAYIKASNTDARDGFSRVAISADGGLLAVGAGGEDSNATGVNGDQYNDMASVSAAAYLFRFDGTDWSQQAYIKASNTDASDGFFRVAISADGGLLAVGAPGEDSNATGIAGDQNDNSSTSAGAVYVY